MVENKIIIPDEVHRLIEFRQRDLPGFATVNCALQMFKFKAAYPWHLSVLIKCANLVEHRLPSPQEQSVLYRFEDQIGALIKENGNALFLARVTHNAYRELMWRVRLPDVANSMIQEIILGKNYPREFDYRIEEDPEWEKASWYLDGACES
jgi:hypothetical protein